VNVAFTAEMEEDLDQISRGEREWLDFIRQFYRGDDHHRGLEDAAKQAEEHATYPLIEVGTDSESRQTIWVRVGRYGPFLQLGAGGPGNTASLPPTLPPADLTSEKAMVILRAKAEGPKSLGVDPNTGQKVYLIHGRFGAYVQLGETPDKGVKEKPKRSSLLPTMSEATVTLDEALGLLQLPRELGTHSGSGQPVVVGLGRFGPYVKHGDDYRSLETTDDLFGIDLARALELFAAPKRSGRRQGAAKRVIARIEGTDGGAPLQVLEGRYGPYVTDGEINASVPQGTDPATLSLEDARALIEARRGAPPRRRRGRGASAPPRPRRRAPAKDTAVPADLGAVGGPVRKKAKRARARKRPRSS
jgi:DNA topoisomerase I